MQKISLNLLKIAVDLGGIEETMDYVFSSGLKKSYKVLRDILPLEELLKELPVLGKKFYARAMERGVNETNTFLSMFSHLLGKTIKQLVLGDTKDQERLKIYLDYIVDQKEYKPFVRYIVSPENPANL